MQEITAKLEAILFTAADPVNLTKLAGFFKLKEEVLKSELEKLAKFYVKNNSALTLTWTEDSVQLVTNARFSDEVASFLNKQRLEPLSPVILEVLAIIAYRGPISRAEIEEIRGVNSSFALKLLLIKGLIKKDKQSSKSNRSFLYEITSDFINSMGLTKRENLPDFESINIKKES